MHLSTQNDSLEYISFKYTFVDVIIELSLNQNENIPAIMNTRQKILREQSIKS